MRTDQQLLDEVNTGRQGYPAWWTGPEMEALLRHIIESKVSRYDELVLDDLRLVCGGPGQFDPAPGVSEVTLPPDYAGTATVPAKKIRIYLGGPDMANLFTAWERTAQGFRLTQPGAQLEADTVLHIHHYK